MSQESFNLLLRGKLGRNYIWSVKWPRDFLMQSAVLRCHNFSYDVATYFWSTLTLFFHLYQKRHIYCCNAALMVKLAIRKDFSSQGNEPTEFRRTTNRKIALKKKPLTLAGYQSLILSWRTQPIPLEVAIVTAYGRRGRVPDSLTHRFDRCLWPSLAHCKFGATSPWPSLSASKTWSWLAVTPLWPLPFAGASYWSLLVGRDPDCCW